MQDQANQKTIMIYYDSNYTKIIASKSKIKAATTSYTLLRRHKDNLGV
jgi:hypothetical protein